MPSCWAWLTAFSQRVATSEQGWRTAPCPPAFFVLSATAARMGGMRRTLTRGQVKPLLHDLCVDLGFCSLGEGGDQLRNSPPATVDEFADAVIVADGAGPGLPNRIRNAVRQK